MGLNMEKKHSFENIPESLILEWAKDSVLNNAFVKKVTTAEMVTDKKFGLIVKVNAIKNTYYNIPVSYYLGEFGLIDPETNNYVFYNNNDTITKTFISHLIEANGNDKIRGYKYLDLVKLNQISLLQYKQEKLIREICDAIVADKEIILGQLDKLNLEKEEQCKE